MESKETINCAATTNCSCIYEPLAWCLQWNYFSMTQTACNQHFILVMCGHVLPNCGDSSSPLPPGSGIMAARVWWHRMAIWPIKSVVNLTVPLMSGICAHFSFTLYNSVKLKKIFCCILLLSLHTCMTWQHIGLCSTITGNFPLELSVAASAIAHDDVNWCPIEWQNFHQKSFLIDVNHSA